MGFESSPNPMTLIGRRLVLNRHEQVRPTIVVVVTPGGRVTVIEPRASQFIRYAAKMPACVIMKQPVRPVSSDKHVDKAVIVVVCADATLRAAHMLAAAGGTNLIVWSTTDWKPLSRLDVNTLSQRIVTYPVVFSPDGQTLGATINGDLRLWNTAIWQSEGSIESVSNGEYNLLNYAPNAGGKLLATFNASRIQFLDIASRSRIGESVDMLDWPFRVAFSPDGSLVVAAESSGNVKLMDLRTKAIVASQKAHSGFVQGLAFSPDGNTLATCGADQVIQLWEYSHARDDATLPMPCSTGTSRAAGSTFSDHTSTSWRCAARRRSPRTASVSRSQWRVGVRCQ